MATTLIEELKSIGEVRQPGFLLAIDGDDYLMMRTKFPFNFHRLDIAVTDEKRLAAHWEMYVNKK